jgi:hypothetical protein|tara:strand:+ start:274 stop:525 length:252 start_codon:yes stop_codon:yes gene_type:complete
MDQQCISRLDLISNVENDHQYNFDDTIYNEDASLLESIVRTGYNERKNKSKMNQSLNHYLMNPELLLKNKLSANLIKSIGVDV